MRPRKPTSSRQRCTRLIDEELRRPEILQFDIRKSMLRFSRSININIALPERDALKRGLRCCLDISQLENHRKLRPEATEMSINASGEAEAGPLPRASIICGLRRRMCIGKRARGTSSRPRCARKYLAAASPAACPRASSAFLKA